MNIISTFDSVNNNCEIVTNYVTDNNFYKHINKITFLNGCAILKDGRKVIAKIYNRKEFFKNTNVSYNEKYLFSVEFNGLMKECITLIECLEMIDKYLNK